MTAAELSTQAHYQIEALCIALQNAARAPDTDTLPYLAQSLAIRIIELNGHLLNVINVSEGDLEELKHSVFGLSEAVTSGERT